MPNNDNQNKKYVKFTKGYFFETPFRKRKVKESKSTGSKSRKTVIKYVSECQSSNVVIEIEDLNGSLLR